MKNGFIDDREQSFKRYTSVCSLCKHFEDFELKCSAFPEGIPVLILSAKNDHSKPLPNQGNDIIFEPIK